MYRSLKPFVYTTAILLVGLFLADCFDRSQASARTVTAQDTAVAEAPTETAESDPTTSADPHADDHLDHDQAARAGELHGGEEP